METTERKPKLGIVLGTACAGCGYSMLDMGDSLLDVLSVAELVFWPTIFDGKLEDLETLSSSSIDTLLYEGAVGNEEDLALAMLAREKARNLFAFGTCACYGGVPGLANSTHAQALTATACQRSPSNADQGRQELVTGITSERIQLSLPGSLGTVMPLNQVVKVDYYLPGCPPPLECVSEAVTRALEDQLPTRGHVFAGQRALCDECPRPRKEKRDIVGIKRFHAVLTDPGKCFLEQGVLCLGPATRGGCRAACLSANIPCRGCMGPTPGSIDQGAEMLSAVASLLSLGVETELTDEELERRMSQIKDPLSAFYMFTLPASLLRRTVVRKEVQCDRQ